MALTDDEKALGLSTVVGAAAGFAIGGPAGALAGASICAGLTRAGQEIEEKESGKKGNTEVWTRQKS